jgi:hypothetical protein
MKKMLSVEEAGQMVLAIYLFNQLHYSGWVYAALFLAPDIGVLGYVFGNRVGAYSYNIFHHKGIAVMVYLSGVYISSHISDAGGTTAVWTQRL